MTFDIFFSICQTPVDGYTPGEKVMWQNFFDQVRLADALGFGTAWVAETHLSCQVQKQNPGAVIPHFQGEIGLNTDILQLAHKVFAQTKHIHVGSAIRNIQCNGGPLAHAEAVRTFLSLNALDADPRRLYLGFAAGRFPFSNHAYGIKARNEIEKLAWPVVRGKHFQYATEIFLRFVKGEVLASHEVTPQYMERGDFRSEAEWEKIAHHADRDGRILVESLWQFDKVGMVPVEAPLEQLHLVIGAHDAQTQIFANRFMPVGVFNLSITPAHEIEHTHARMQKHFHGAGGAWTRAHMPRTVLVFIDDSPGATELEKQARAHAQAQRAMENYWRAIEGTLMPERIAAAVDNALVGSPVQVASQMRARFHPDDRLMLWFDFNDHDNEAVKRKMRVFAEQVRPFTTAPEGAGPTSTAPEGAVPTSTAPEGAGRMVEEK